MSEPLYRWPMRDASILVRSFDTPDILEPYTTVILQPGQEAIVFTDDRLMHLTEVASHMITGNMRVDLQQTFRILQAGGTVHTSFGSAITLFDVRTRLLPTESLMLKTADGSQVHLSFGGAFRIADPTRMVMNALHLQPCAGGGAHELRMDDPFVQDVIRRITDIAAEELAQAAQTCAHAEEAKKRLPRSEVTAPILRRVNDTIRQTGFLLERLRPTLTERACPYCHRPLSMQEIRNRRCGDENTGCNRPLEVCPECGALVTQEYAACPRCAAELTWCDRCRRFAQVEKGRFCIRCHTACYPPLPRELLQIARHT